MQRIADLEAEVAALTAEKLELEGKALSRSTWKRSRAPSPK
jgi:hypothetical protein